MTKKLTKWQKHWLRLGVLAVIIWAAWSLVYPSGIWRYKLTVEVETPEGIKTGSTVREVRARRMPKILPEMREVAYNVKGEAVVIDLGDRGIVYALLRTPRFGSDGWLYIVFDAFPSTTEGRDRINYYEDLEGSKTLLPRQYPMFVRFRDPTDPKTVENLLEYAPCADERGIPRNTVCLKQDRFAEAFGEGVALKSVTIEMTREPVTTGVVERYAPKFSSENRMAVPGQLLSRADFIKNSK